MSQLISCIIDPFQDSHTPDRTDFCIPVNDTMAAYPDIFSVPFSDPVFQQHIICFASPYTLHFFIEMSQILRMDKAPPHPGKSIYIFPGQFKIIYCLGRPSDPSRYILHKIVVFPELAD